MFALNDTIVACATAPPAWQSGLRAAIRISGPATHSILSQLSPLPPTGEAGRCRTTTDSNKSVAPFTRGIHTAFLPLTNYTHLPLLILAFPTPNSYTGEDVAELLFPSNPYLVDRVLAWLTAHDHVRLAHPGEFTARAFLRGRLSLEQAEGVGATIAAQSLEQIDAAKQLLSGRTGNEYRLWADEITNLLALVEAGIDFTDQEDVVPIAPNALSTRIGSLITQLQKHAGASAGQESQSDTSLPLVALIGKPNAGKSTLFNALLGHQRAIASPLAGTTRDVIIERLNLSPDSPGAGEIQLADFPGLDATAATLSDQEAQRTLHETLSRVDLFVWCDPTGKFDERDLPTQSPKPTLRVQTFADKITSDVPPTGGAALSSRWKVLPLPLCALDGWNLASLRRAIADQALSRYGSSIASLLPRHRRAIDTAASALRAAHNDIYAHAHALANPEALAEQLRIALTSIGELVGTITPDDVIGRVFATFCVGK
ncbi:MAG: GTPase [Phycisphaerales bacterium]